MTVLRITILSMLLIAFVATSSEAGWLIYHEPEFNGKILDIETKQPIEGAVVVVEYSKESMGVGAGNISWVIGVREALTDKEGKFHFPSYTTLIQPFSWQTHTVFIIYKPGYASLQLALKDYLTEKETSEMEGSWPGPEFKELKYKLSSGLIELPKLTTREQRLLAKPSPVTDIDYKKQKLLIQLLNEERKNLGLKGQYKLEE